MQESKMSAAALAGFIVSIIALLLSAVPIINNFSFVLAVAGLILGIVGLSKIKKGKRTGKGIAIAAIIMSVLAFIVVLASQAFYGAALDEASKSFDKSSAEFSEQTDKATGKSTDTLLKNDVSVDFGKFVATQDEYGLTTTSLPVTVTNKNKESKSYTIQIEALDSKDNRVAEDTVNINNLGAGKVEKTKAFEYVDSSKVEKLKKATFKVSNVSQF